MAVLLYNVEQWKSSSHVVPGCHQVGKRALCKMFVYRDTETSRVTKRRQSINRVGYLRTAEPRLMR